MLWMTVCVFYWKQSDLRSFQNTLFMLLLPKWPDQSWRQARHTTSIRSSWPALTAPPIPLSLRCWHVDGVCRDRMCGQQLVQWQLQLPEWAEMLLFIENVTHRQLLSTDQVWRRSTDLTWSRWGCRRLAVNIWLLAHDNNNNWKHSHSSEWQDSWLTHHDESDESPCFILDQCVCYSKRRFFLQHFTCYSSGV